MNWKDTKASLMDPREDDWGCPGAFNYDLSDQALSEAIAKLSVPGLIEALKEVKGCGCRVDSPGINVRNEIFERVYAALDAYENMRQDSYSNNPGDY